VTVAELEALFRSQIDDRVAPYLVSFDDFLSYLNEAQEEACVRANLLFDRTSPYCTIPLTPGIDRYALSPVIYSIAEAFVPDSNNNIVSLKKVSRIELDRAMPDWRERTGTPRYMVIYDDHIELAPKPDVAIDLSIECYIFPASLTSSADEPVINQVNHKKLLDWVKYRVFSEPDNDLYDNDKGQLALIRFDHAFGTRKSAERIRVSYQNRPNRNQVSFLV